jgi:polyhydroxybutyrate depolymerase
VHVPEDYDPSNAYPLVVLLHGQAVDGFVEDTILGVGARVTSRQFIEVVPDGTPDSVGALFWNATGTCCGFEGIEVDDVGYLTALIDEAEAALAVDPRRVYLVGHSNGAFMAYRLACDIADRLAGIACLAGSTWGGVASCKPARALSVLAIHGTKDEAVDYDGGSAWGFAYDGVEETVAAWAGLDGCATGPVAGAPREYDDWVAGAETLVSTWSGCAGGVTVELWRMEGSTHMPSIGPAFQDDLIDHVLAMVPR